MPHHVPLFMRPGGCFICDLRYFFIYSQDKISYGGNKAPANRTWEKFLISDVFWRDLAEIRRLKLLSKIKKMGTHQKMKLKMKKYWKTWSDSESKNDYQGSYTTTRTYGIGIVQMSWGFCLPLLFSPSFFAYMLYDLIIQLPPGGPGASPPTFGVCSPDLLILRSVFWLAFHGAQIR